MKTCILQPQYSRDASLSDALFEAKIKLLDECCEDLDLIVLPEFSDVPCATETREQTLFYHHKYIDILLERCVAAAKRCHANVFVNALSLEESGYRNTTYVFDRTGTLIGKYFKKHLPPLEVETLQLDGSYTKDFSEPYVLEIEGLRYAFLTCYDFYFYESFAAIAQQNVDIIIGCSLQRSDTHDAIETICRFLAYNTNAYVVRASVSFDESSDICGASMVVSPYGKVLQNMHGRFGKEVVTFDPKDKYYKPAGFGNPPSAHYQYIEYGRRPWQYRNAGPSVVLPEKELPYPRMCAHRGFNTVAPENSMPAFGAAVALGAQEIEFDLWSTKDGVLVSCHDATLERVSNGEGKIYEKTYAELLEPDFGIKYSDKFAGLKIPTFEEILKHFAGRTIMNIHVKIWDEKQADDKLEEIVGLIRKYDAQAHVYFMSSNDAMLAKAMAYAPDIPVCVGFDFNTEDNMAIVHRAIALGAKKIQLFKPHFDENTVKKAHEHGILCNVFWSDDVTEANAFLDMGIDCILTNDYQLVSQALKK